MKIDRAEAARIAALAHLRFDDSGLDRMAAEMTKILGYIESIGDAPAEETVAAGPAALREDRVRPSLELDVVEGNAPIFEGGFFVVPKVIE